MTQYELSKYDFEALDKLMANAIGDAPKQALTVLDKVTIERLKEKFVKGHSATIEMEDE